jgi:hypothetical protein
MSVLLEKVRFTPANVGTWLDGAQGWHNTYRVIDLAQEAGMVVEAWRLECVTRWATEVVSTDRDAEVAHELGDEATEYLRARVPDGYDLEWDMGELSMVREDAPEVEHLHCTGPCHR